MRVFRPKTEAWLTLLIVGLPIAALAVAALVQDPSGWLESLAVLAFAVGLLSFNATARLVLTGDELLFKRYGWTVWRVPLRGTHLLEGRAGQPPILPAYLLRRDGKQVGYLLKVWFSDSAIAEVRRALA